MKAFAVSRWGEDPWSAGSWSLIGRNGTPADRTTLGAPIGDRLRLAGEATHATRAGMTHGAYEQGLEAAAWAAARGHTRIAVVGAGIAGLAAAREARARGLTVDVWEARDRIGGRTAGVEVGGFPFDLGANWLQQYPGNALARLAESLGLTTVPTDFTDPLVLDGSPPHHRLAGAGPQAPPVDRVPDAPLEPIPDALEHELRSRLAAAAKGESIADVVEAWQRDPEPWTARAIRRFVDAEIVMDTGVPLSFLSARHGFEPGVGEGDRWIVGSYRLLVSHLAEGLNVRTGRPVQRIQYDDYQVTLTGNGFSERFDAAIVTVPVGVLQAGRITFEPPLPRAQAGALGRLGMGRVEKVVLRFDRRFWPMHNSGYYRVHGPADGDISEWLDAGAADGSPTLVGLFAGPWLDTLWTGTDAEVAQRAAAIIAAATGAPVAPLREAAG
ncbi:flavin monoamine oxidase family protein [Symbioplanes lichenis]|uniref:flavin monoamine oxidase family protein n=1 Tax=Symbioplanes lichenis TaxID=1629072 RepID=UPI0027386960|nr:FAD-dependent oxidoreductase [Actinoplanes lichenis]